jgi:hypothetical protein
MPSSEGFQGRVIVRERISEWTLFGNTFDDVDGKNTHIHQTP